MVNHTTRNEDGMNLQQHAVESVKRRGFHEHGNIPPAAHQPYYMQSLLTQATHVGKRARQYRKGEAHLQPVLAGNVAQTLRDALLMAQALRHYEENGELAEALIDGDIDAITIEVADVFVTLSNIAALLEIDIESAVMDKLAADERRGHLHGEKVQA